MYSEFGVDGVEVVVDGPDGDVEGVGGLLGGEVLCALGEKRRQRGGTAGEGSGGGGGSGKAPHWGGATEGVCGSLANAKGCQSVTKAGGSGTGRRGNPGRACYN